jgi:hypothetical protein
LFFHTSMNFPLVRRCTGMLLSSRTTVYLARKNIAVSLERGVFSFIKRRTSPPSFVGYDALVGCDGYI